MKNTDPIFPNEQTVPTSLGLTKREYAAIHIYAGMGASTGLITNIRKAIIAADQLLEELDNDPTN